MPDIIITYGANFQERIKDLFKANERLCAHWSIAEDGKIKDCFRSQTKIFECSLKYFISRVVGVEFRTDDEY